MTTGIARSLIQSPCNRFATAGYVASRISALVKSSVVINPISKASYCKRSDERELDEERLRAKIHDWIPDEL